MLFKTIDFIKLKFVKLKSILLSTSNLKFILLFTTFSFLASFITVFVYFVLTQVFKLNIEVSKDYFQKDSLLSQLVFVSVVVPILETIIFQYFFYEAFFLTKNNALALISSSALFGLSHFYDPMYVVNTFFTGLVLGIAYILAKERNQYPIWITSAIHALHNFIIVVVKAFI